VKLQTVLHRGASLVLILAKYHEANRIKQHEGVGEGGGGGGRWAFLEDKRNTCGLVVRKPDTRKPLVKP